MGERMRRDLIVDLHIHTSSSLAAELGKGLVRMIRGGHCRAAYIEDAASGSENGARMRSSRVEG